MKKILPLLYVLILITTCKVNAQEVLIKISGTVIGYDDLSPLPGATISIKGKLEKIFTDYEGKYFIEAPVKDETIIVYSFPGYKSQEMQLEDIYNGEIILESRNRQVEVFFVKNSRK